MFKEIFKKPVLAASLLALLDIVFILSLYALGSASLLEIDNNVYDYLISTFNIIHKPILSIAEPFFIQYTCSHGCGLSSILADIGFYLTCVIYMFLVGLIVVSLYNLVLKQFSALANK